MSADTVEQAAAEIEAVLDRHPEVRLRLKEGPVTLNQQGEAAAMLVSLEEWNRTTQELGELRTRRQLETGMGRLLTNNEWDSIKMGRQARTGVFISGEELRAKLRERHPNAGY